MARIGEAAAAGAAVDMGELLGSFANDLACRAVMGKSFRGEGRNKLFRELVSDTSPLLGGFNVEEFFPFLARFGVLSRAVRAKSKRLRRRWDEQLDRLIQDHESSVPSNPSKDNEVDFIHILHSVRHEYGLTREQMKAILLVSSSICMCIIYIYMKMCDRMKYLIFAGRVLGGNRDRSCGTRIHRR